VAELKIITKHYNTISIYLWMKYPDHHFFYKYGLYRKTAEFLENDFIPKENGKFSDVEGCFSLYDDIRKDLLKDNELIELFKSHLTDDCYSDPTLHTLTFDLGHFIANSLMKKEEVPAEWQPTDYNPRFTAENWTDLLSDETIATPNALAVLKRLLDAEKATCTQLSEKYGESKNFYNSNLSTLGEKIQKRTNCPMPPKGPKYLHILCLWKKADKNDAGRFTLKLRNELSNALAQMDLSSVELYAKKPEKSPADGQVSSAPTPKKFTREDFLSEVYMSPEQLDELSGLLDFKQNIILQGAPGVGKTFAAKRLAYLVMGEKDNSRIESIQFHQNYSYEDFIMGYKPAEGGNFELRTGVFYDFCQKAKADPDHKYFFLIDEINRGNLSKIFGELLMLLEKDYRGPEHAVRLAYKDEEFFVPENLYLIGMMNTADSTRCWKRCGN